MSVRTDEHMLMIAIVDGLAIQHGLDPDGVDVRAAVELWERLARATCAESAGLSRGRGGAGI